MKAISCLCLLFIGFLFLRNVGAQDAKPLTPLDAIKKVNKKVLVQMQVKATKNRLEKRGEIYLDSEQDFRDEKNLGIVVTRIGAAKFKEAGVGDPAVHFKDKTIRVRGTVIIKENRPRIEVDEPRQIQIVGKKTKTKGIEGIWTQVYSETDGDSSPSMKNVGPLREAGGKGFPDRVVQYVWKFSKEAVETGWDTPGFPWFRSPYQLNPGGKMGAIDITTDILNQLPLGEKEKKRKQEKMKGIFLLKDDLLIICFAYGNESPRPETFATSPLSSSRLVILRRGKLKN